MSREGLTYVYIASMERSGSTLLAALLATHSEISTVAETSVAEVSHNETYRCSCGELYIKCSFWKGFEAHMRERDPEFALIRNQDYFRIPGSLRNRLHVYPAPNSPLDRLRDLVMRLDMRARRRYRRIAFSSLELARFCTRRKGGHVFVDAMKDHGLLKNLYEHLRNEVDLRVIHLVRDPRGTVNSLLRTDPSRGAEEYAKRWVRTQRNIERAIRLTVGPERSVLLRYDLLCENADAELGRLAAFLGIENRFTPSDIPLSSIHLIGNHRMRHGGRTALRHDQAWKDQLGEEATRTVLRIAGEGMRRVGFDLAASSGPATGDSAA